MNNEHNVILTTKKFYCFFSIALIYFFNDLKLDNFFLQKLLNDRSNFVENFDCFVVSATKRAFIKKN